MKLSLPVSYPPITSFTKHANILSILSNDNEYLSWFLSNYIQLWYRQDLNILDFYMPSLQRSCPLLYSQCINRDFLNSTLSSDITDFFVECISQKYYISVVVDEYYVPPSPSFMKYHHPHELFIYGFDLEQSTFNVADFFSNRKYQYSEIEFDSFVKSYLNVSSSQDYLGHIYLYKTKKKDQVSYKFDLKLVKKMLAQYLEGENSTSIFSMYEPPKDSGWCFGTNIYFEVSKHINSLAENLIRADIRLLHILYDHKKCMEMRVEYMIKNGHIHHSECAAKMTELSTFISQSALLLRNLAIKNNKKFSSSTIRTMIDILEEMIEKETFLIKRLLSH